METAELRPRLPPVEPTFIHAFLRYVAIALRYRVFILITTALAGAAALALCVASVMLPSGKNPLPNQYTADATILVPNNPSSDLTANIIAAVTRGNEAVPGDVGFEYSALVLWMLHSRQILDQIVQEFNVDRKYHLDGAPVSRARTVILGHSHFAFSKINSTLTISYRDTDPAFARDVVNRMVILLNNWFTELYGSSTENQKQVLEKKMGDVQAQIASLQDQIKALQQQYGFLTSQDLAMQLRAASPTQRELPAVAQQFNNLSQALDVQRGIYATLSHQYELAKLSLNPVPSFQILELADLPDHKSGPSRTSIIVMTVIVAFFASLLLSFLFNFIRRVRNDPEARRILAGDSHGRKS